MILAGRPPDETWDQCMDDVVAHLDATMNGLKFGDSTVLPSGHHSKSHNRRGDYESFNYGISYGGGQKVCIYFCRLKHWLILI